MTLNAVSLFAGVGGIDLALERAGVRTVAAVEIDTAARGVLAHRFPATTLHTDVCEVSADDLLRAGFVPRHGILAGGFPCQDLSVAGARAGLAGARSGLFWHIVRLADELKPQWLLLENVPGLLNSAGGRDMGTVIRALVDCGYGLAWRVLDAQGFGVPQRRRRVVIVGCAGDDGRASSSVLALAESGRRHPAPRRTPGEDIAYALAARFGSAGTDATDALNGHVIAQPFVKGKRAQTVLDDETWRADEVAPTLTGFDGGDSEHRCSRVSSVEPIAYRQTAFGQYVPDAVTSPVLAQDSRKSNDVVAFYSTGGSRGLHGYRDLSRLSASDSGLGIPSPPAVLLPNEIPPTNVRRLTPTECERLQGFPDGWTAERVDFKRGKVVAQADSPRYKQMGNAVAVPVFEWVARRIVTEHEVRFDG